MKIVDPLDVQHEIEALVDSAAGRLTLVTPYFKPWPKLGERLLRHITERREELILLVRKDEPKALEAAATYEHAGARIRAVEKLHAKVYLSSSRAIVTSMNLYEASRDSEEIAVLFQRQGDEAQYVAVEAIVDKLKTKSVKVEVPTMGPAGAAAQPARTSRERPVAKRQPRKVGAGTCIRCGDDVVLNPDKPLCRGCYEEWARYENPDYEESYCHQCGTSSGTSVARPLCRACWRANG